MDPLTASGCDTVIIGAGQAGLALGYHLQRAGHRRFVIVDAADEVGDSWRRRWDSLTLFTPRRYDALPGLAFPGDPEGYPGKDEVAAYLQSYATAFALPVALGARVRAVRRDADGTFAVQVDGVDGTQVLATRQVVVATGGFTGPYRPAFAGSLGSGIAQVHSSEYRNPGSVPGQHVVVVGGGNTGVQIAEELSGSGRRAWLSAPTLGRRVPQRLLGRDIFWWFDRLGTMNVDPDSRIGRRLRAENTIVGTDLRRLFATVERLPRAVDADGEGLVLADGQRRRPDAVVWATGYRPDFSWLHLPVLDEAGRPIHYHGITDVPGLAFIGLPWQRARGSALLGYVGRDAALLAEHLDRQLRHSPSHRVASRQVVGATTI